MMKTVPYEQIENRLAICCEFLLDRKKPIQEAYESLMEKLGTKLMEYSEFEYWFRRFQNNQFDLGYDKSLDTMYSEASEVEEVPIMKKKDQVERETRYLNSDLPFNVVNVPNVFRTLILTKGRMYRLKVISIDICDQYCTMKFNEVEFHMQKIDNDWMIAYKNLKENVEEPIKTEDPEKSIIDHLWFVLKDPRLKLGIIIFKIGTTYMDLERLNLLLQSMLDSIDHQIRTNQLYITGLNQDTLFSLLNHFQPGTLTRIDFNIAWKK
ncbi:unnamed protein product [Caenorhabditis brenneri]